MTQVRIIAIVQTTEPRSVRRAFGVHPAGIREDVLVDSQVTLRESEATLADDVFALFDEWNSEADFLAYSDF